MTSPYALFSTDTALESSGITLDYNSFRIQIARDKTHEDPPWTYEGAVHLPDASYPVRVDVSAAGDVTVHAEIPEDLSEKVRLIVRTVYRQAKADGEPPAWRIVRWRGEK